MPPLETPVPATGLFTVSWLLIAIPAVSAAILLLVGRRADRWAPYLGAIAPLISFALGLVYFVQMLGRDVAARAVSVPLYNWISSGRWDINVGLLVDQLSIVFVLLITGVGGLIHVYSIGYMAHDDRRRRFFAFLNLFVAAMLLLVLADNYLVLFVGWEGVGLASYLLIGFWQYKPTAATAAKKAFVVNRVGDMGMSLAIMLMLATFGSSAFVDVNDGMPKVSSTIALIMGLLLLLAACGKSAQVPLQSWLLDAMEGPTPVSALIHAATMVTAGVYLITRSNAIYAQSPAASTAVVVVGTVTLLFGAWIGCAKDDIKRVLAGSTMSQIGYMMLAAGIGPAGYAFAIFHLLTHGFFKADMFLGAGSVMHATNDEVDMRHYGALRTADADHLRHLRGRLSGDYRLPVLLRLLLQGPHHRGGLPAKRRRGWSCSARRRRHGLLHDPSDVDDVRRQEALEAGCAPSRVTAGDDGALDLFGHRLRPSAAWCSTTGLSAGSIPR